MKYTWPVHEVKALQQLHIYGIVDQIQDIPKRNLGRRLAEHPGTVQVGVGVRYSQP